MAEVLDEIERGRTVLHIGPEWEMSEEQFFRFCQRNKEYRIERSSQGDLIIMSPEAGSSGSGGAELTYWFQEWARRNKSGVVFSSSTGFILPNKAVRSPDVSWVSNKRLSRLSKEEWNRFLPLCPDFVLELRSPSDRLRDLQDKMVEYIKNGARLGWLLDPGTKKVHVYRPDTRIEILSNLRPLSGEPTLKGFELDIRRIWEAMDNRFDV